MTEHFIIGTYLSSAPTAAQNDAKTFVISCPDDKAQADKLKRTGIKVMDKEFLLSGLLKYKLETSLTLP